MGYRVCSKSSPNRLASRCLSPLVGLAEFHLRGGFSTFDIRKASITPGPKFPLTWQASISKSANHRRTPVLRRIVEMIWFFMKTLQESVEDGMTTRLQDAVYLACGSFGLGQMLKDVEGKDPVEDRVTKWKMVCVAHNIGVPKILCSNSMQFG